MHLSHHRLSVFVCFVAGTLIAAQVTLGPAHARQQTEQDQLITDFRRAEKFKAAGKLDEAARLYRSITARAERLFGADHRNTADLFNNYGMVLEAQGKYDEAAAVFRRCARTALDNFPDGPEAPRYLTNLGSVYRVTGQFDKGEKLLTRALKMREKLGRGHEGEVAETQNCLATLYWEKGDLPAAEPLYQSCLKLREKTFGPNSAEVADTLNLMGQLYSALGQDTRAVALFRRGLKVREDLLGRNHLDTAASLNDLAVHYLARHKFAEAEPYLRRTLKVVEARNGPDHPNTAKVAHNLAWACFHLGKEEEAARLQALAVRIWSKKLGANDPLLAGALSNQGVMSLVAGEGEAAEARQRRALKMREASLGPDHPNVAASLGRLADVLAADGRWEDAATTLDRGRRLLRHYVTSVLPGLAEPVQLTYLRWQYRPDLSAALSLAWHGRNQEKVAELSAGWVRNGKGVANEVLAAQTLGARDSHDARLGKLTAELASARERLARLTLAASRPGQEKEHRTQVEELSAREQDLARGLRKLGSRSVGTGWVELDEVRKGIPPGGVLIDVAYFDARDLKAKPDDPSSGQGRYAACLTPKEGAVRLVDLGPARAIDAAVKEVRKALTEANKLTSDKGEEEAEKAFRGPLEKLSKLVLAPLLPHVGKSTKWLVGPDGSLWLFPWEALLLGDGHYVVEKHQVSYLVGNRDLEAPLETTTPGRPLVLADPDFDLSKEEVADESKLVLSKLGTESATRSLTGALRLGRVPRLPGTRVEARAITPALEAYAKEAPRVLLGKEAVKAAVLGTRSPRVLVLSTHGYFLSGQDGEDEVQQNPLLRCGLLFAGASFGKPTGVLTGLEAAGAELRGCQLVVLSACETGLGDVRVGEGVAGLRQAFQQAGARAVVSTLWQVPDGPSAKLMDAFFRNLSKGKTKAEALREAQLKLIAERRDDFLAAHPFYWAAFTMTGR